MSDQASEGRNQPEGHAKPYVMWHHMDSSWRLTDDAHNSWGGQIEDQEGIEVLDLTPLVVRIGFYRAHIIGEFIKAVLNGTYSNYILQNILDVYRHPDASFVSYAADALQRIAATAFEQANAYIDNADLSDPSVKSRIGSLEEQGDLLEKTRARLENKHNRF